MSKPYIFISYRRNDALAAARGLMRFLQMHFGITAVFMDTAEIRIGDDWKRKIDEALKRATIIIPIIGRHWIKLSDDFGQRRIDKEDDWVRHEISYGCENNISILPIYVGIDPLPEKAFPISIRSLAGIQAVIVRGEDFEWKILGYHLQRLGLGPLLDEVRYPRATVQIEPLSEEVLRYELASLPGWRNVATPLPGKEHVIRSELHASFEFPNFNSAIKFMNAAASEINRTQHHPRWENIWRTVNVYLSTWDLQFQISSLDIALAKHLTTEGRKLNAYIR